MVGKLQLVYGEGMTNIKTFIALMLLTSAGAWAQNCPQTCTATPSSMSMGTKPAGMIFTVTPLQVTPGSGQWVSNPHGGGNICSTCTQCKTTLLFSYNTTGAQGSWRVIYNECGVLAEGPNGGSNRVKLSSLCGASADNQGSVTVSVGAPNPAYNGTNCPPESPILGSTYSEEWSLACGNCI